MELLHSQFITRYTEEELTVITSTISLAETPFRVSGKSERRYWRICRIIGGRDELRQAQLPACEGEGEDKRLVMPRPQTPDPRFLTGDARDSNDKS
jgi:hypothetical protein